MLENEEKYLKGFRNRIIRYYFYLSNGLDVLNNFRNLFIGILGIYIALKLTNLMWMAVMVIPSFIILTIVGYYFVHHVSKIKEWLGMRFGTHFGIKSFDYQKGSYEALLQIQHELLHSHSPKGNIPKRKKGRKQVQ